MVKNGTYGSALEWYLETRPSNVDTFAPNAKVLGSGSDDFILPRKVTKRSLVTEETIPLPVEMGPIHLSSLRVKMEKIRLQIFLLQMGIK